MLRIPYLLLLILGLCHGNVRFSPSELHINIDEVSSVQVIVENGNEHYKPGLVALHNERTFLANVDAYLCDMEIFDNGTWTGAFNVTGVFLGNLSNDFLLVQIAKEKTAIDVVFTVLVLVLAILSSIIIGTTIDLTVVRSIVIRPVGPIIGFVSQFTLLPLIFFPDIPAFQLGLFFTGISPGGGMSNLFTYLLGGNLNLSVTMTTISSITVFGTIPIWIFILGQHLLDENNLKMPYLDMVGTAIGLLTLLSIGLLLKRYKSDMTVIMLKFLKPLLIVVLAILAVVANIANLYIFKILTWNIMLAAIALPMSGYILGWCTAKLFCRSTPDTIAIAVEVGIQNIGIPIFLLASVGQPPLIPFAVAMMTPLPLGVVHLLVQIKRRWCHNKKHTVYTVEGETAPMAGIWSRAVQFVKLTN